MEWVYKFSRVTTESPGASLSLNSGIFSEEISFENCFVGHVPFFFFFFFHYGRNFEIEDRNKSSEITQRVLL